MTDTLTIWTKQSFSPEAERLFNEGTTGHRVTRDNCAAADIAFGQPDPDDVTGSNSLKWIALTSAGYTRYDTDTVRKALTGRGAVLTNASGVYDEPCAQHALAFLLADLRGLPIAAERQREARWDFDPIRKASQILGPDHRIAIFGFGAIAKRFVELVAPFGPHLTGVRRRARGDEPCPIVKSGDEQAVRELLGRSDVVLNILPAGPTSDGYFNADRIGAMKRGAIFLNIGRGTTVDSSALRDALTSGALRSAWLDVTDPEPLPSDHPLWHVPTCHITPHTAGGRQDESAALVRHFLANLRRFEQGQDLRDRVI